MSCLIQILYFSYLNTAAYKSDVSQQHLAASRAHGVLSIHSVVLLQTHSWSEGRKFTPVSCSGCLLETQRARGHSAGGGAWLSQKYCTPALHCPISERWGLAVAPESNSSRTHDFQWPPLPSPARVASKSLQLLRTAEVEENSPHSISRGRKG